MAVKYQLITELYRRTGVSVAKSPQAWQSFLSSACRNYKCRFDEQLLIYAQRPDAVAVAELGTWNKLFKRWVNKDSKGIAVFDPKGRRNTLKYYFDISDTHEGCMIPLRGSTGLSITEGIILPLHPMKAIFCYVPLKCLTMMGNLSGKRICSRNGRSNRTVLQLLWKPQAKPLPFLLEKKPVLI